MVNTFKARTFFILTAILYAFGWFGQMNFHCQARSQPQRLNRSNFAASSTTSSSTSLNHRVSPSRKACGLYVWDVPSALLHRWCKHLQKDCTYEGRGGKRFVRVRPGSMLQLLHPCNRYSPDKCFLCGGCYKDHLILGWAKHLYKPFDRYLDREYEDSLIKKIPAKGSVSGKNRPGDDTIRLHAFHRRYVLDISQNTVDKKGNRLPLRERQRVLRQEFSHRFGGSHRQPVSVIALSGNLFIPDKSPEGKRPSLLISLCRLLLLDSVKSLYQLQRHDNARRLTGNAE